MGLRAPERHRPASRSGTPVAAELRLSQQPACLSSPRIRSRFLVPARPVRRAPSKRPWTSLSRMGLTHQSHIRIWLQNSLELAGGVDALYLSGRTVLPQPFLDRLEQFRSLAEQASATMPFDLGGECFGMAPHAFGRYRYCLEHADGRIGISPSPQLPAVRVQPRSGYLHTVGLEAAVARFRQVLETRVHRGRLQRQPDRPLCRLRRVEHRARRPRALRLSGGLGPHLRGREPLHRIRVRAPVHQDGLRPHLRQDGRRRPDRIGLVVRHLAAKSRIGCGDPGRVRVEPGGSRPGRPHRRRRDLGRGRQPLALQHRGVAHPPDTDNG